VPAVGGVRKLPAYKVLYLLGLRLQPCPFL
jgi:hypothetical protein